MRTISFTLKDCDGVEHLYEVQRFSVAESTSLQLMLAQPLLEVAGQVARVLAKALGGGEMTPGTVIERLGDVDMEGLLASLPAIPRMIEERGGHELITRILKHTTRYDSTKDANGNSVDLPMALSQVGNQDLAYGDGNYLEMWSAVLAVLVANFTRHGRGGSLDWKSVLKSMTGGLLKPSATEITKPSGATKSASE